MKHVERLIDRIIHLDGLPDLRGLAPLRIGETAPETLRLDLEVAQEAITRLNAGIARAIESATTGLASCSTNPRG